MRPFFKDDSFDFLTRIALGCVSSWCTDAGEVLATIDGIRDGDADGWVREWRATAERLDGEAARRRAAGHRRAARPRRIFGRPATTRRPPARPTG
jgi:hypothetical protein